MPRSSKANLPWVDEVASKIARGLTERYARPMIYRQSGPYNQSRTPHVGIFFNDPIFHQLTPVEVEQRIDFRFGFYLERDFDGNLFTGFAMHNSLMSTLFMMPNIRADRGLVAGKLSSWLRSHDAEGGYVQFGADDGGSYFSDRDDGLVALAAALGHYASPGRGEDSNLSKRSEFRAISILTNHRGGTESDLVDNADEVASSVLLGFGKLDFLYLLLFPRELGPARVSGGQNRALKTKQPERRCAWLIEDQCRGIVDAAHIKPDRLGGLAVPGNLIWLCRAHHRLVDVDLKAELSVDHSSRQLIASVRGIAPPASSAEGATLAIWKSIQDRKAWPLPLRTESIAHLFE